MRSNLAQKTYNNDDIHHHFYILNDDKNGNSQKILFVIQLNMFRYFINNCSYNVLPIFGP